MKEQRILYESHSRNYSEKRKDDRKLENHRNDDRKACKNENFEVAQFIEHMFL